LEFNSVLNKSLFSSVFEHGVWILEYCAKLNQREWQPVVLHIPRLRPTVDTENEIWYNPINSI